MHLDEPADAEMIATMRRELQSLLDRQPPLSDEEPSRQYMLETNVK